LLLGGILFFFRNVLKKKSFAYPIKDKLREKLRLKKKTDSVDLSKEKAKQEKAEEIKNKILNPVKLSSVPLAESVLVLKGHRNKVAVLCLKIKNLLTKSSKENLEKLIQPIEIQKGSVYRNGDYIIGVFSPLVTKSFKNETRAAKAAQIIQESLKQYNTKFTDKIKELTGTRNVDRGRLEQEVALFAKNCDISEELTRLKSHLVTLKNSLKADSEAGKKLDFMAQELHREANTIGSKSSDFKISRYVIQIKSDIEKIREQVKNIE